jgi:peptidyl-tRNA hydrolase, PTH1 family
MRIVVGLGNPGREYASTRHNIGFMVVNELARRSGADGVKKRFRSEIAEGRLHDEKLVLVAPQTYMNLSGHAVREAVNWYHVSHEDVLIVFDDMDLPFGQLRLRKGGSAGGHNGLKSIIEQLGGTDIPRLRVGIGRSRSSATSHVLSRFSPEEEKALPELIGKVADAVELWMTGGITVAMNAVNQRPKKEQVEVPVSTDDHSKG